MPKAIYYRIESKKEPRDYAIYKKCTNHLELVAEGEYLFDNKDNKDFDWSFTIPLEELNNSTVRREYNIKRISKSEVFLEKI